MVANKTAKARIRVGIGGWIFPAWRDNFYPADLVQRRELEYASRRLGAIEINSTFYRAQKPATYASWASQTPEDFVFSVKAPRYISQSRELAAAGTMARRFIEGGLAELGPRLGPILWQLAPTWKFNRDDLAAFLDALPRALDGERLRHVLEVRHRSFLDPAYVALARDHAVATVFTDSDDYPSLADITGDFIYARLMRTREELETGYTAGELDGLAQLVGGWSRGDDPAQLPHVAEPRATRARRDVFAYFISGAKARNPAAAMALIERLSSA
ncbi:MAG: DUF72 domain-containing protein [Lysobacter sp.]|nr:DUF72 domain-containing protein [Lysobacter sp.]MDQ3270118.1 DUF72 domain-containing protein [Pseudomonadota bacterium]